MNTIRVVLCVLLLAAPGAAPLVTVVHEVTGAEQRKVVLPDGSIVQLQSRSVLHGRFSRVVRRIKLSAGEARVHVAHGQSAPFLANTIDAFVRATGTTFNLLVGEGSTDVTLIEGRISVAPFSANQRMPTGGLELLVGQHVKVQRQGQIQFGQGKSVSEANAWPTFRDRFPRATLADVAKEVNRYHDRRIIVDFDESDYLPMHVVVDVYQSEEFWEAVARIRKLRIEHREDGTMVLKRQE